MDTYKEFEQNYYNEDDNLDEEEQEYSHDDSDFGKDDRSFDWSSGSRYCVECDWTFDDYYDICPTCGHRM